MVRRLRWLALLLFLTSACVTGRRVDRLTVTGDALGGQVRETSTGCDYSYTQEARHVGGGVGVRREDADGVVVGGLARVVSGRPIRNDEYADSFDRRRFELWAGGLMGGYHWDHVGVEAGISVVRSSLSEGWIPIPALRLLVGTPRRIWFELEGGSQDPLWYTGFVSTGIGLEDEAFRLRGGLTLYGVPTDGSDPDQGVIFAAREDLLDTGVYIDGLVRHGRFGLVAALIYGENSLGRLGFSVDFD
ncbi:MAG: hypothetical protein R3F60_30780 [bacterium]